MSAGARLGVFQGRGESCGIVELGFFNKHLIKNTIKRGPTEKQSVDFSPRYS